ncbi:SP family arabinose:H+ symporter-like MFS transporter [Ereboglobus sp. PH5-10]|uniref:sugar porter family MFS transporter n=1 Tax=Ereboglobus sp. PH5-10 TaxID=2940629 RepID=UPI0024068870|nr:sugar porter family MFS transporter [Ereboglobus sp. PH5-10]MDF9826581.1 SP family arabinose:H+ symporter-like MFS transporter [Ereboglobus sp. PH5-10]
MTASSTQDKTASPNSFLLRCSLVAALGGLLFGFDTVVISGAQNQLKELFQLSGFMQGFMTASALIGTVIGALLAARPSDALGRKRCLQWAGVLFFVSAAGCAFAWDFWSLIVFRVIGGLGIGGSTVICPLYLAEISPARWRGRLGAFFQFNIVLGILVAYLSNYLLGLVDFGADEWRWKLGVEAFPALLFWLLLRNIPESPRWLIMRGRADEASHVFAETGVENPAAQVAVIQASLDEETGAKKISEPLFRRIHALPVFLAVSVAMFNQLDGINALLYYLSPIFGMAGFDKVSGDLQSVLIGATNLVFTMLGMAIIDRVGRKTLLLGGAIGTGLCLLGVAWIFTINQYQGALVWLLVGYIACHAFGQGAVIWVFISEVFPNQVRSKGQVLGSSTHWIMAAAISWLFPVFAKNAGEPGAGIPFYFFAAMMVLQVIVVLRWYPETKGVPLEEIQKRLSGKK